MYADLPTPSAEQIFMARKAAGLSQEKAGKIIGRSRKQWMRYESGEWNMDKIHFQWFKIHTLKI